MGTHTYYPELPSYRALIDNLVTYSRLKHEHGARGIRPVLLTAGKDLLKAIARLKSLPTDQSLELKEPNDYPQILRLRPRGPHCLWRQFHSRAYQDRLQGALLGRCAGNVLGAPVEFWSIDRMGRLAKENHQRFPPREYWRRVPDPLEPRIGKILRNRYSQENMRGVPTDDDLAYTLLGLLIAEEHGLDFTVDDVGKSWVKYLPFACTAEEVALKSLRKGIPAGDAADRDNPYCEWIGAAIRADSWGYLAPGWPERAARMAYRDAYVSHRRQGIYGAMYFSAAIAAAFAVDDPVEALRLGLREIPRECALARAARWALATSPAIRNHRDARAAIERKLTTGELRGEWSGMHPVHAINNACLTIWGITIGKRDFSRVIGETVAMGMDNDCTAATAGSIVGAVVGKKGIPRHWYSQFNNTIHSYLVGKPKFRIDDVVERYTKLAQQTFVEPYELTTRCGSLTQLTSSSAEPSLSQTA